MLPASRAETIAELERRIRVSREAYVAAATAFNTLIAEIPSGLPESDGTFRLSQAGRAFRTAISSYSRALRDFHEFLQNGTPPDDPERP